MLKFLKEKVKKDRTENGAVTYTTSQSDCLDLFATIGALRRESDTEIMTRFHRAWAENPDLAMKILFFARDIRGGLGERRIFRTILHNMSFHHLETVARNLWAVPEFGRFDDLLCLLHTPACQIVLQYIKSQFDADMDILQRDGSVSLLGKWLPSINTHNPDTVRDGKIIAKALGLNAAEYRRALTALRANISIVENNLRQQDYTFAYENQPSKAMLKYRKAFLRNDGQRYKDYLVSVENGTAKLNTATLMPYEIIRPILSGSSHLSADERHSIDITWKSQKDFTRDENALVVVDGSGSMYGAGSPTPASVALSLGIYFAEHNRGAFHNHFITFSRNPRLIEIKGQDIFDKVKHTASYNEIANTNIQKVFQLILNTAVDHHLSQIELPSTLYIITDMEFDSCAKGADITNFEYAKREFGRYGYSLPTVVFWNVASRNQHQPVTMNEKGVVLVSGASPQLFSMISSGTLSPYSFMLDTLDAERYSKIRA